MYEKQTWTNGEVITDTKLNHMEDGIASNSKKALKYVIDFSGENQQYVCSATLEEIIANYDSYTHISVDDGTGVTYYAIVYSSPLSEDGYGYFETFHRTFVDDYYRSNTVSVSTSWFEFHLEEADTFYLEKKEYQCLAVRQNDRPL